MQYINMGYVWVLGLHSAVLLVYCWKPEPTFGPWRWPWTLESVCENHWCVTSCDQVTWLCVACWEVSYVLPTLSLLSKLFCSLEGHSSIVSSLVLTRDDPDTWRSRAELRLRFWSVVMATGLSACCDVSADLVDGDCRSKNLPVRNKWFVLID